MSKAFPDAPFEYSFMDDTLQKLYKIEIQLQKAARVATTLALLIVLLGVLGLVSLNVTRRTREIGVRKVLGASTVSILGLFLGEFVPIFIAANVLAWPLAYWVLNNWLAHFAYRMPLTWLPFALVGGLLAFLTALIVSAQAIRATRVNPVKSLKTE